MSTPSSTTFGLSLAADYPDSQTRPGESSVVHTDTETLPSPDESKAYIFHAPWNITKENRNIKVQTKIFRTDYSNAGAAAEYQNSYNITINKQNL